MLDLWLCLTSAVGFSQTKVNSPLVRDLGNKAVCCQRNFRTSRTTGGAWLHPGGKPDCYLLLHTHSACWISAWPVLPAALFVSLRKIQDFTHYQDESPALTMLFSFFFFFHIFSFFSSFFWCIPSLLFYCQMGAVTEYLECNWLLNVVWDELDLNKNLNLKFKVDYL